MSLPDHILKDMIPAEDGYHVYWPSGSRKGSYSAANLREIADKLDELNAPWDAIVQKELGNATERADQTAGSESQDRAVPTGHGSGDGSADQKAGPSPVHGDTGVSPKSKEPAQAFPHVVAAAIRVVRLGGAKIFSVPKPGRHHHVIEKMSQEGYDCMGSDEQGFLLSDGTFVRRRAAGHAAKRSGQIQELKWPPDLYSEDLW